jgi:N-acetylglutamate synthase-like GNAT family acetyltransferase
MPTAAFTIKPFTAVQRRAVANLVLDIQRREFGIPVTLEAQPDLVDIAGFFRKDSGEFWVALSGRTTVGTIGLVDMGEGRGALRKMFVHAAWRGAEKGVAQGLLDTLLRHAATHGMTEVLLGTIDKFVAAQRFYRRNGFVEIAESELPASFPRMSVDTTFFRRRGPALA